MTILAEFLNIWTIEHVQMFRMPILWMIFEHVQMFRCSNVQSEHFSEIFEHLNIRTSGRFKIYACSNVQMFKKSILPKFLNIWTSEHSNAHFGRNFRTFGNLTMFKCSKRPFSPKFLNIWAPQNVQMFKLPILATYPEHLNIWTAFPPPLRSDLTSTATRGYL